LIGRGIARISQWSLGSDNDVDPPDQDSGTSFRDNEADRCPWKRSIAEDRSFVAATFPDLYRL
jgi:hypothetical protein